MTKAELKKALILGLIVFVLFLVGYALYDKLTADIALWICGGN